MIGSRRCDNNINMRGSNGFETQTRYEYEHVLAHDFVPDLKTSHHNRSQWSFLNKC